MGRIEMELDYEDDHTGADEPDRKWRYASLKRQDGHLNEGGDNFLSDI